TDLLLSRVGLGANLLECVVRQPREENGYSNPKDFQRRLNLWPPGLTLSLLGFVIFAYGYWNAKFGSNLNWPWLPVFVFGGLLMFACGVFMLLEWRFDTPLNSFQGTHQTRQKLCIDRVQPLHATTLAALSQRAVYRGAPFCYLESLPFANYFPYMTTPSLSSFGGYVPTKAWLTRGSRSSWQSMPRSAYAAAITFRLPAGLTSRRIPVIGARKYVGGYGGNLSNPDFQWPSTNDHDMSRMIPAISGSTSLIVNSTDSWLPKRCNILPTAFCCALVSDRGARILRMISSARPPAMFSTATPKMISAVKMMLHRRSIFLACSK